MTWTFVSHSETETAAFARALAATLQAGDVVLLRGPLGAGKSALARAVIAALANESNAPSPSYALVEIYHAPSFDIWHADLYRMETTAELQELGLEDAFGDSLVLVEWPERAPEGFFQDAIEITFTLTESGERKLTISGAPRFAPDTPSLVIDDKT